MNAPETAAQAPDPYRALPGARPLALWAAACLAVHAGETACRRCPEICPAGALRVADAGPEVTGDCLACGRCAGACPTGALRANGFDGRPKLPDGNSPVRIECWKVPRSRSGPDALRVPCLAGLSVARLVELAALARGVEMIDRGWCAGCRAGAGARAQWEETTHQANEALWACGVSPATGVRVVKTPLPEAMRPEAIPSAAAEITLGRRAFFSRLRGELARHGEAPPVARASRAGPFPLPGRKRLLKALQTLAGPSAAVALPAITVSAQCANHGVCAAACPTRALRTQETENASGLMFDAMTCVACGLCVRRCPQGAIALRPATLAGAFPAALTRFEKRLCAACREPFAGPAGEAYCVQCATGQRLARDLFGPLLAKQEALDEPFPPIR